MRDYLDGTHNWEFCGNCNHQQLSHTDWVTKSAAPYTWDLRCHVTYDGLIKLSEQCSCTEWVPKDNLDQIEFLAEKRNLL